jgi:murein DD-endopeptidase MepM/ murein hydrolase activator NlpD
VPNPERVERARVIGMSVLWGFFVGVLTVTVIVWRAEPVETWLGSGARFLADRVGGVDRWDAAPVDDDSPVGETTHVGTAGTSDGPEPTPSVSAPPSEELEDRDLLIPVEGVDAPDLVSSFHDRRGGSRTHEAIDILAPMGTPVRAVEDGRIAKLFNSKAGGITIYQFDPGQRYCYYYAHLDRYAEGLRENDEVRRGQVIGYVGVSGNAPKDTPHLHFAIFKLTDEKRWWEGTPLDPYPILR